MLAGAVQLKELILPAMARAFPELGPVRAMNRIKFNGRITPGNEVRVRLLRGERVDQVEFEIHRCDEVCSRGVLTLLADARTPAHAERA